MRLGVAGQGLLLCSLRRGWRALEDGRYVRGGRLQCGRCKYLCGASSSFGDSEAAAVAVGTCSAESTRRGASIFLLVGAHAGPCIAHKRGCVCKPARLGSAAGCGRQMLVGDGAGGRHPEINPLLCLSCPPAPSLRTCEWPWVRIRAHTRAAATLQAVPWIRSMSVPE